MVAKKLILTFMIFALTGFIVCGVGFVLEPDSSIQVLNEDSACPVVSCESGSCHGFDNVPQLDGSFEMTCPEAGCAASDCHAWDTLQGRYKQASDASLNLWILAPVVLVITLLALIRVLSNPKGASLGVLQENTKAEQHNEQVSDE